MLQGPLRVLTHRVGHPTSTFLRHPLFKMLSCVFVAAVVLQYSGILLLTQRYTMSRFYDVMFLVSNHDADNATGSRRSLLEDVIGGGGGTGRRTGEQEGKHKRIIARYLQQPKQIVDTNINDEKDGVVHSFNNHKDQTAIKSTPYSRHSKINNELKGSQKVPDRIKASEDNSRYIIEDTLDEDPPQTQTTKYRSQQTLGFTKVPSNPNNSIGKAPTRTSVMAPMWKFISRLKGGLLPTTVTTTPIPKEPCPKRPSNLDGPVPVLFSAPDWEVLERSHQEVEAGGHWRPQNCSARHKVAIVIPFRDRDAHLRIFLQHMHPFLQKQLLDYTIYVVEQTAGTDFNRAMLMNVGFVEAERLVHHTCFVFHDVDLLPEMAQNMYSCPHLPRHMSAAVDSFGYRLPYAGIFGGVSALRTEHFRRVNGFSNCFFGWGGEDDDMYNRIKHHGLDITRYPLHIARYRMLSHKKEDPSNDRFTMLNSGKLRFDTDGVTSLVYDLTLVEKRPLYTLIQVSINKDDVIKRSRDMSSAQAANPPGSEEGDGNVLLPPSDPKGRRTAQEKLIEDEVLSRGTRSNERESEKEKDQLVVLEENNEVLRDESDHAKDVAGRLERLLKTHNDKLKKELLKKEKLMKEYFQKENLRKEQQTNEQFQKVRFVPSQKEHVGGQGQLEKDSLQVHPSTTLSKNINSGEQNKRPESLQLGRARPNKTLRLRNVVVLAPSSSRTTGVRSAARPLRGRQPAS